MQIFEALAHLLNLLAAPAGMALAMAVILKLLWRRAVRNVGWGRLLGTVGGAVLLAQVAGWVLLGRDGRMGTYALMALATAAVAAWLGRPA